MRDTSADIQTAIADHKHDVSDAVCKGLINLYQTPEQRRLKYYLARALGATCYTAQRLRDWRWNTIARYFGYKSFKELELTLTE